MKGPSRDAVHHAISILLESLNANNDVDLKTVFPLPVDAFAESTHQYTEATNLIRRAFLQELDDRTIHRHHNNQLHVGRLPVELLVEIFHLSIAHRETWRRGGVGDIREISRVCVRWRSIITATPHFWTDIHATDGPIFKHHLERSGTLPLSITLQSSEEHPLPLPVLSNFMTTIRKEAYRFCDLEVDATYEDWKVIAPHMAQSMPLLETAELRVGGLEEHDLPPLKFGGGSKLWHLRLSNVVLCIPRTDDVEWPLTSLYMDWIWESSGLIRILRRFSALTELIIRFIFLDQKLDDEPENLILVTLPHLEVMEVEELFDSPSTSLIRCIHAPNIKRFHISDNSEHSEYMLSLVAQPPLSPDRATLLQSTLLNVVFKSLKINLGNFYVDLIGIAVSDEASTVPPDEEWGLDIRVSDSGLSAVVDMLRHVHFPDAPTYLQIEGFHHDPSVLRSFPYAVSIILSGDMGFMEECVVLLRDSDEHTGKMVCPSLSELHLDLYITGEEIPRVVLEANEWLMRDIQRLVRTRRMVQAMTESDQGLVRVTCDLKWRSKERCLFNDSGGTGHFVDEESS